MPLHGGRHVCSLRKSALDPVPHGMRLGNGDENVSMLDYFEAHTQISVRC